MPQMCRAVRKIQLYAERRNMTYNDEKERKFSRKRSVLYNSKKQCDVVGYFFRILRTVHRTSSYNGVSMSHADSLAAL